MESFSWPFLRLFLSVIAAASATPTLNAVPKDQIACTMCSECDNPCQPTYWPPPPPPPPEPPVSCCLLPPPPPPTPCDEILHHSPPPPPAPMNVYYPPPGVAVGGGSYPPPPNGPYFPIPYYYRYPPPLQYGWVLGGSARSRMRLLQAPTTTVPLFLTLLGFI